ncbi:MULTISPECIES: hypothetical protein [Microbacterium]|uniref:hypothetical protein n=1 Tax=Microbacterium TaxID=33882 RepID=UPI000F8F8DD0|nr:MULTISPECIES: hypothetical protein [Microbacterium]AZS46271.1 hypothetical protein CVS53_00940 [Microbacterium oxydans]WKT87838.1 hypothetical protein QYR02_10240 [Microbacterium liquefaciens]
MKNKKRAKWLASAAVTAALVAGAVSAGQMATSVEIGTLRFASEYTCQHTVREAVTEGKKIRQGCTYAGPTLFGLPTAAGPWIAVIG